jgi:lysophospholipid hydrolase
VAFGGYDLHQGHVLISINQGVPVDIVGGTSIGSLAGALYADELGYANTQFLSRFKAFCKRMQKTLPQILDLTYPIVAMFSGRAFNR